jgi:O-succinylbenzoate synthase
VPDVACVVLREIALRLREPFRIASGVTDLRRVLLVELRGHDGESGWAECVAGESPNYSAETIDTAWLAITQWVAPLLLTQPWPLATQFDAHVRVAFKGHRMAKAAVEMALWDLAARHHDTSLARLLGGNRPRVETGISIGMQANPDDLAARVQLAGREGYRRIKVKIRPGEDLAFVEAARAVCPPDLPLSVDANASYSFDDLDTLRRLDRLGLRMIEQPFGEDDLVRHARLQRELETDICLDESITSVERVEDMVALASGRIINIKPGRVGGHTESRAIHDRAAAHHIPVWCGGMLETGIGRAHNVALASLHNFSLPGDLSPSARYWDRDIVLPPWTMREGCLEVPEGPGIGVALDHDFIDDLTQRTITMDRA